MNCVVEYLKPIIIPMLLVMISGFANANMDIVAHKYSRSIYADKNENFYNPNKSWVNKWKLDENGDPIPGEERFFGSSTFLVATTDFWHLMQMLMLFCFMSAITVKSIINYKGVQKYGIGIYKQKNISRLILKKRNENLVYIMLDFVLLYLSFTVTFEAFYRYILIQ